jgi:hypothetical protein
MAQQFPQIEPKHRDFIERQHMFFTASATHTSRVNISPRSTDALRVLDAHTVTYLDLTGSGNETAAHLRADGRMTVMLCAVEGPPLILRLYGRGQTLPSGSDDYEQLLRDAYDGKAPLGARQIVRLDIDLVQTSCGFGVPLFDYSGERETMARWAEAKGEEGLVAYRLEKNTHSIDGLPTGIADDKNAAD